MVGQVTPTKTIGTDLEVEVRIICIKMSVRSVHCLIRFMLHVCYTRKPQNKSMSLYNVVCSSILFFQVMTLQVSCLEKVREWHLFLSSAIKIDSLYDL